MLKLRSPVHLKNDIVSLYGFILYKNLLRVYYINRFTSICKNFIYEGKLKRSLSSLRETRDKRSLDRDTFLEK